MFFWSRRQQVSQQPPDSSVDDGPAAHAQPSGDEDPDIRVDIVGATSSPPAALDNNNPNTSHNNSHSTGTNKHTSGNTPSPTSPSQSHPSPSARGWINTSSLRDTSSPSPHRRMSSASEGYPSWLPRRPPPPPPASTFHSSVGALTDFDHDFGVTRGDRLRHYRDDSDPLRDDHRDYHHQDNPPDVSLPLTTTTGGVDRSSAEITQAPRGPSPFFGGRRPTPRSVRIVSLQDAFPPLVNGEGAVPDSAVDLKPTDRLGARPKKHVHGHVPASSPHGPDSTNPYPVLSRAAGAGISAAAQAAALSTPSHPRFNARGLHLQIFRSPSKYLRFYFYLYPLLVFAHVPIQTFLDFNAVFILIQVSKFPNPLAPGIPGSGRNWALGAAAYIACWLVWALVVTIIYEVIYSFFRRWRLKRPAMMPLYLSSSAFNCVCLTSYSNFCFMQHLRLSAFTMERGSIRDGLAETFYFYSQNLPTVALLLPRTALCLALLLAYGSPLPQVVLDNTTITIGRDSTFFAQDGSLSGYAKGVLIANAAWTAWRILVLLCSWIGLWFLSEQGCAGMCGPRYRWEEEEVEKRRYSYLYGDAGSEDLGSTLAWSWRQCTRMRIQHAFEFCLTMERPRTRAWAEKKNDDDEVDGLDEEGVAQVLAAIGFPSAPPPVRRSVLSGDLFQDPKVDGGIMQGLDGAVIPRVVKRSSRDRQQLGVVEPYPFTMESAHASSADGMVPFPPSPTGSGGHGEEANKGPGSSAATSGSTGQLRAAENPTASSAKTHGSGSLSSFGQPVSSRYPFQFRESPRPPGENGGENLPAARDSSDGGPATSNLGTSGGSSRETESTTGSSASASQSSVNVSSSESGSQETSSEEDSSGSGNATSSNSGIPMPPRHPQPAERRSRARGRPGTGPTASSAIVPPVVFPRTQVTVPPPISVPGYDEHGQRPVDDDQSILSSHSEDDSVALLSPTSAHSPRSPRPSFIASVISGIRGSTPASRSQSQSSAVTSGASSSPVPPSSSRSYRSSFGSANVSVVGGGDALARSRSGSRLRGIRTRTSSTSAYVRSRTQSLMQGIGAASHSSIELVQNVISRVRTDSMARLDEGEHEHEHEGNIIVGDTLRVPRSRLHSHRSIDQVINEPHDAPHHDNHEEHEGDDSLEYDDRVSGLYDAQQQHADLTYQSDGNTHSRNASGGSGSAVSSSNENYTFGHPFPHRSRLPHVGEGPSVPEEAEGEQHDQGGEVEEEERAPPAQGQRSRASSGSVVVAGVQQATPDNSSSVSSYSGSSRQRRTRLAQPAPPALSPMRPRMYHTATTATAERPTGSSTSPPNVIRVDTPPLGTDPVTAEGYTTASSGGSSDGPVPIPQESKLRHR